MKSIPKQRVKKLNGPDFNSNGICIVYWMNAFRRLNYNFSLQHAAFRARLYDKPLIIVETLTCNYPWANDRFHRAALDGMLDNHTQAAEAGVPYFPFVEAERGQITALIRALAQRACCIVTDDFPSKFHRNLVGEVSKSINVALEAVDSNGILPMAAGTKVFATAYSFRRFLQKVLPTHLAEAPEPDPLGPELIHCGFTLPPDISKRWTPLKYSQLADLDYTSGLPIDHSIPSTGERRGSVAARSRLETFIQEGLPVYNEKRNLPSEKATSLLSGFLHNGHISAHEIFHSVVAQEDWSPAKIATEANGKRSGWWGASENVESFLDELITWREIGYNMACQKDDYDQFRSLPEWAVTTLHEHSADERPHIYDVDDLESGQTHDELWNAAQMQLVQEGMIHNYLRMLWGKKILEWTHSPEEALEIMIELNNKYAVDGRNPNSYSGIFWILGRYDRPWGPERPIFGKVRYMSSDNTARKFPVKDYIRRYQSRRLFD